MVMVSRWWVSEVRCEVALGAWVEERRWTSSNVDGRDTENHFVIYHLLQQ